MIKLGAELPACLIKDKLDPTKIISHILSSEDGRLSWENTTQKEPVASMGNESTNDNTEGPFGNLTLQLDIYSTIGINYSSALSLARYNKDFYRNEVELCKRRKKIKMTSLIGDLGNFFNLDFPMSRSLL